MARPSTPWTEKVVVRSEVECWDWLGPHAQGYSRYFPTRVPGQPSNLAVHRMMYENLIAPIPKGLVIDHLCRNRGCVNPWHMEPVSIGENVMRGETIAACYASRSRCVRGHLLEPDNLKKQRGRGRECRQCDLDRKRKVA